MPSFDRLLAIMLLLGAALLGAGAVMHPMLTGDAATDLRIIAGTAHWRLLHLLMLAASGLIITGIWVRITPPRAMSAPLVAALVVITVGLAINALNIGYMAGTGLHTASMFRAGRSEAIGLFEATHPIGLVAARLGNYFVALGALLLGFAEWQDATQPRWVARLAWLAAVGGLVGVIFFDEASPFALAAVALLSAWELATVVRVLRGSSAR